MNRPYRSTGQPPLVRSRQPGPEAFRRGGWQTALFLDRTAMPPAGRGRFARNNFFSASGGFFPALRLYPWPGRAYNCRMYAFRDSTIAAIATPPGRGGVGIVRLSGPRAGEIAAAMFRSRRPDFGGFKPYRLHSGQVLDLEDVPVDDCLAVFMPGPGSFTGEDVAEFQCHGAPAVLRAVLVSAASRGARQAEPGEFSYRAFANGRLDLTQAEAVAELINAPTRAGAALAAGKLSGALGARLRGLRERLATLRAGVCLAVDFPEEDAECLAPEDFSAGVQAAAAEVQSFLDAAERARCWREGALVVMAGRVNAGKSSLMNALLGRERAIVCELPGTTRDYLEEGLDLDGLPVRLVDTAGLRDCDDLIEMAGVERSRDLMENADLILLMVDRSWPLEHDDRELAWRLEPGRTLVVLNKCDLTDAGAGEWFRRAGFACVEISARTGQGLDALARGIRERVAGREAEPGPDELAPNLRQAEALRRARAEFAALTEDIADRVPYDLLGVRLETACSHLSEITGEVATQDVLNDIFSRFCIGK